MSILIKGMDMPTRCFACPMCCVDSCGISHGSYIEYREVDVDTAMNGRPDWCPLIPVPPHGRLVDADKLNKKPKKCFRVQDGAFPKSEWFIRASDLFDAPTIIPAEEVEG